MSEVFIVAEMEFAPGREEEALAVLSELCERTHAEDDGCLLYAVHRVKGEDSRAFLVEKWRSRADLEAHAAKPHVKVKQERESELFAGPSKLAFLEPTEFGIASMARF
jgi:quinol monooxygenase YgiN